MNHVIYADEICLLAPSAIGLQLMSDVCFNFSICNDIIFNPVKFECVAFQPKKSKLFCPNVTLDNNVLEYIGRIKYFDFMFNSNGQDDEDMLRQMRNLYTRSNKLLRTFHYCYSDIKLELFKSYCTSFYCCYLWTACKNQYSTGYVLFLITHTVVFSVSHGDAALVRCTLTLELVTLKQLLENQHLDLYNG